jgi:hypothetical protein
MKRAMIETLLIAAAAAAPALQPRAAAAQEACAGPGQATSESACIWATTDCGTGPWTGEVPEDGELLVWAEFEQGTFPGLGGWDDRISSIEVGANSSVRICTNPEWQGSCTYLETGCHNLSGTFNNSISSIRIDRTSEACWTGQTPATTRTVYLYEHANTPGSGDCTARSVNVGVYTIPSYWNAGEMGLRNDSLSSVRLGPDTTVVLYRHPSFGTPRSCASNVAGALNLNLSGSAVGNDHVSSMEMGFSGGCGPVGW